MKKSLFLLSLFVLFGAALSPMAISGEGPAPLPAITVEDVSVIDRSDPKTYVGTVHGSETVDIVPRVSGSLWTVAFREGSTVKEGDLLFEIENTVYKANVLVADALIKQAESELELAKKDHERNSELLKSRAISTQAFDTTLATQLLQEAKLEEAKANRILKQHDLDYCRIISPISGRIGEKSYSEGNYITPSSGTLATIVSSQPSKVHFSVSESDFFRYFENYTDIKNTELTIITANGKPYTGQTRLDFVDNIVDRQTGTLTISLLCDNPDEQLLPGGFVQIQIAERFPNPIPAVPLSAIMTDGTNHYVYVVDASNIVQRRTVEIGRVVGRYQTINSGLDTGERVAVGGMNKIRPGALVEPVGSSRNF